MRFGLFGSAQARRPDPGTELTDSSQGFREWIENNIEAEALGFHSTFVVEHHFTGFGQVSASLNPRLLRLAQPRRCASARLSWCCRHNPVPFPSRPQRSTSVRGKASISASARATATTSSPGSA